MANLDTRNKRGSAIGLDTTGNRVFPNPSGGITTALHRAQAGTKYAFESGSPGGPPGDGSTGIPLLLFTRGN